MTRSEMTAFKNARSYSTGGDRPAPAARGAGLFPVPASSLSSSSEESEAAAGGPAAAAAPVEVSSEEEAVNGSGWEAAELGYFRSYARSFPGILQPVEVRPPTPGRLHQRPQHAARPVSAPAGCAAAGGAAGGVWR